ncbi:hypothetical protein DFH09DRAFT_1325342 [Mycena vulgaris]|nr:hypothetical protein DFH09DRAFT_1325342 [Mycena vulgaris]
MVNKPGLFAAGYTPNAVVEAILTQHLAILRTGAPVHANCSSDVQRVVLHVDKACPIQAINKSFGMGTMTHPDDVAGALRTNIRDWQQLTLSAGPGGQFFKFRDALEIKDDENVPPARGWKTLSKHGYRAGRPRTWPFVSRFPCKDHYMGKSPFTSGCGDSDVEWVIAAG